MPEPAQRHLDEGTPGVGERTRRALAQRVRETREARAQGKPAGGHPEIDLKVFELTRIAVARIDRDPSLVRIGLENIERSIRQQGGYVPPCHAEWKALIETRPWSELRALLLENSDEGQRHRSNHPFMGLVTAAEREAIYGKDRFAESGQPPT
ncbi:MAG: hypothetical protein J4F47_11230 [Alphaproteobacteria bacterium]|nr:hypothetical protein [Alphaproteobacteria bacterium]